MNGNVLIKILIPVFAPILKDVYLECVAGNKILAPSIKPAAHSITKVCQYLRIHPIQKL